jgi:hydroxymethylpyrimidine pyrophosphatase-like HAD family hydrolase
LSVGILGPKAKCELAAECFSPGGDAASRPRYCRIRLFDEVRVEEDLWWCEVSAADADKGIALARLLGAGRYSCSAPLVVLGDGSNDVGMATLADIAICPPWASETLREIGTVITNVQSCRQFVTAVSERIANWREGE